jgi:hypothetical protein
MDRKEGVQFSQKTKIFYFSKAFLPSLGPNHPFNQLVPGLFPGGKAAGE